MRNRIFLLSSTLIIFISALTGKAQNQPQSNATHDGYEIPEDAIVSEIITEGAQQALPTSQAKTPSLGLEIPITSTTATQPPDISTAPAELEYVDYSVGTPTTELQPETRTVDGYNRITINLDGVSLEDTVRMFGQTTGANIIAAPNLFTGKFVTVSLNDVDWIPALRSILEIHNFALVERTPDSGVFTVTPRGADAPEPMTIKTFFPDYTTAGELRESVTQMLDPRRTNEARALDFSSRNALVVRSTEKNLAEIEKLIENLDKLGRQVLIEVKILELGDEAAKQVGIKWDFLRNYALGLNDIEYRYSRQYSDRAEASYERQNDSSATDSTTLSSESTYDSGFGSDQFNPGLFSTEQDVNNSQTIESRTENAATYSDGYDRIKALTSGNIMNIIFEPDDLTVMLSALEETEGVSIVSNPKMVLASGATNAFFRVGDREPIIKTETEQEEIGGAIRETKVGSLDVAIDTDFIKGGYLETGIDITIAATVKTDDMIEAFIKPVLRRVIGQKFVGDNSWPIISVKEIGTSFTLRSGQTVAIGGLTYSEDSKEDTRVPLLGSIPVIGRLFSHKSDKKDQRETIIFVTLSIADPGGLQNVAGVPEDARLIFKRMLRDEASLKAFQEEMAELQEKEREKSAKTEKSGRRKKTDR